MPIQAADRGKTGKGDFWSAAFWRPRAQKRRQKPWLLLKKKSICYNQGRAAGPKKPGTAVRAAVVMPGLGRAWALCPERKNVMMEKTRILLAGDSAVSVQFGDAIDPEIYARVRALYESLKGEKIPGVTELIPTFRRAAERAAGGKAGKAGPGPAASQKGHHHPSLLWRQLGRGPGRGGPVSRYHP